MAQKREFRTGDIVRLKSGGPKMTVTAWNELNRRLACQWFAGAKLHSGFFDPDSVEPLVEDPDEATKN